MGMKEMVVERMISLECQKSDACVALQTKLI